jgi:nicotinamide-nucleotide amidase
MIVELINTGSELLLGRTLNTHQLWLCRQMADLGWPVSRQVAVADTGPEIQQAVRESLGRADLVLVTGGLGPTSDDITRELIADLVDKPLREDPAIVAELKRFFAERNRPMPVRNLVQALVPEGAIVLPNPNGTAPGLAIKIADGKWTMTDDARRLQASTLNLPSSQWIVMLPGPPRELRPMFTDSVVPLLQRELPRQTFVCHTLRTSGIGESALAEIIDSLLHPLTSSGLELGYCARPGQVDVRLVARNPQAEALVSEAERIITPLLSRYVYSSDDEDLEMIIVRELTARKQTLAIAESCTGGWIAHRITNVPGASAILIAGLVTYANAAKEKFAGVRPETLAAHGAVSEPVAREMAEGARQATDADFALAVTGIAGPSGGTPEKPVGTVFMAVSSAAGTVAVKQLNRFDRETFKDVTAQQVLGMLRRLMT